MTESPGVAAMRALAAALGGFVPVINRLGQTFCGLTYSGRQSIVRAYDPGPYLRGDQ